MEGDERPIEAVVLAPPPPPGEPRRSPAPVLESRTLHRPPGPLRLAFGAALRAPGTTLALAAARLLRFAAGWAPALLAWGTIERALGAGEDPVVALSRLAEGRFLLPTLGLAFAASLTSWAVELAVWSGGTRVLLERRPGAFAAGLADSFPRMARLAIPVLATTVGWVLASGALILAAGRLYLDAASSDTGVAPAAAALALAVLLFACGTPILRWIAEAAVARVGTRGDGALVALFEGARLLASRPFFLCGSLIGLGLLGSVAAALFSLPILAAGEGPLRLVLEALPALVASFFSVWRMGLLIETDQASSSPRSLSSASSFAASSR